MILTNGKIHGRVQRKFCAASLEYERLTEMHQLIGQDLFCQIKAVQNPLSILDVGMGTGWLTEKISDHFPQSHIVGLDFAEGMVYAAHQKNKNFSIVQARAEELPFKPQSFDLIVSNLAYQWVNPLPQSFSRCWDILKPEGKMIFAMFGYKTFQELFVSFEEIFSQRENCLFKRLSCEKDVTTALCQAGFKNMRIKTEEKRLFFNNMMDLLKWIKNIGANALERNFYVGRNLLHKVNRYYDGHFKDSHGVYATFEIIWVEAEK